LPAATPAGSGLDVPTAKPSSHATAGSKDIEKAVEAVYPALVRIHIVSEEGRDGRMQKQRSSGSGAIISKDGYILTNHHVAGRATRIVCRLSDREEVEADLVGTDALTDLAVLKLNLATRRNANAPLAVAEFGDSDKLKVGDVVLAMGSPAGLSQSVTRGIVANTEMISPGGRGMTLDGELVGELVRWIGHDAVIFPGNSGGPLVNIDGKIVGVNEVSIGSLGGAIPGNLAKAIAKELIAKGYITRSWVGLEVQPLLKEMKKEKGVLVSTVLPNSPAQKAGIMAGDFITEYNGTTVVDARAAEDLPLFNRLMLSMPVGATAVVKGVRDGKPMTWSVVTVKREPNVNREGELRNWGLTVRDFTRVMALEMHRTNQNGVLVDSVQANGPSSKAKPGLAPGDIIVKVNDTEIPNAQALRDWTAKFMKGLTEPKPVLVTVDRGGSQLISVPKIGPEVEQDKPEHPARPWLGVSTQVLNRDLAEILGVPGRKGVRVTQIMPESPAEKAGIKVGDLFFMLDGQPISASNPSDEELFENLIRQYKVDSEIELEGRRGGESLKLKVTLGKTPKPASELPEYNDDLFEFSARDLAASDRVSERLKEKQNGVRVSMVKSSGWAALAGMYGGDILLAVDGKPVDNVATLKGVMKDIEQRKPMRVKVFLKRGIYTQFIELEPKW
jgi:serine protease Do